MKELLIFTMTFLFGFNCHAIDPSNLQDDVYYLVVNKNNPIEKVSKLELAMYYLGKGKKWPNNKTVLTARNTHNEIDFLFLAEQLMLDPKRFEAYWNKKKGNKDMIQPRVLKNDEEVIDFVVSQEGAIGVVSDKTNKDVKYISIQ